MPHYETVNEKVLRVETRDEPIFARRGAMIACRGELRFSRSLLGSGGVKDLAQRAVAAEGIDLMRSSGSGEIFYAHHDQHVTVVELAGGTLHVESSSVLAFDARVQVDLVFLGRQGVGGVLRGVAAGQGLFTSTFTGKGQVALLSDGDSIGLQVRPERPIFVDPDAYIAHLGQLSSQLVTDVGWKNLLGQASGESYQLKFTGTGTVYIQASER